MGNIFSDDTCCTISGKDFNAENNKYTEFMQCCDRNNCCDGPNACVNWLDEKDSSYTICANACNGFKACDGIGENAEKSGPKVTINQGSCDGSQACSNIGRYSKDTIEIRTKSCIGTQACSSLGAEVEKESIIADWGSCVGDVSCAGLGAFSSKGVDVGYLSCQGDNACNFFGFCNEETTIGSGVCTFCEDSECSECRVSCSGEESCSDLSPESPDPLIATIFAPFFCPYN